METEFQRLVLVSTSIENVSKYGARVNPSWLHMGTPKLAPYGSAVKSFENTISIVSQRSVI